jgi:hypothetical protein
MSVVADESITIAFNFGVAADERGHPVLQELRVGEEQRPVDAAQGDGVVGAYRPPLDVAEFAGARDPPQLGGVRVGRPPHEHGEAEEHADRQSGFDADQEGGEERDDERVAVGAP